MVTKEFYKSEFFTAALWGAMTFAPQFAPDVTLGQVVAQFKLYFDLDDEELSTPNAKMAYNRLHRRILDARKKGSIKTAAPLLHTEALKGLEDIREILNNYLDNLPNGKK